MQSSRPVISHIKIQLYIFSWNIENHGNTGPMFSTGNNWLTIYQDLLNMHYLYLIICVIALFVILSILLSLLLWVKVIPYNSLYFKNLFKSSVTPISSLVTYLFNKLFSFFFLWNYLRKIFPGRAWSTSNHFSSVLKHDWRQYFTIFKYHGIQYPDFCSVFFKMLKFPKLLKLVFDDQKNITSPMSHPYLHLVLYFYKVIVLKYYKNV